jgi:two-component system, chemotaxis family, protein-glutamate methylesterase/glutaminase
MNQYSTVVIGGSAGSIDPLCSLVHSLPADFPCAVFVVVHTGRGGHSNLPHVLNFNSSLVAVYAEDGIAVAPGRIYVAPPDLHLTLDDGRMRVSPGPKENRNRPSINPLFRSAALTFDSKLIGVLLSGMLDDGTLGLWEVKKHGGLAVVQDPGEAAYSQMPKNALENVAVDYSLPVAEIGKLLTSLCTESISGYVRSEAEPSTSAVMNNSEYTQFECPDCGGTLKRITRGPLKEFRCTVGHSYSPESALLGHAELEEMKVWGAMAALLEGADLAEELAASSERPQAAELKKNAKAKRTLAQRLETGIKDLRPPLS